MIGSFDAKQGTLRRNNKKNYQRYTHGTSEFQREPWDFV